MGIIIIIFCHLFIIIFWPPLASKVKVLIYAQRLQSVTVTYEAVEGKGLRMQDECHKDNYSSPPPLQFLHPLPKFSVDRPVFNIYM